MARRFTDTSDFFAIDCGDEVILGEKKYIIRGYTRERRFGIEDPKYWVKWAMDAETGERKIIKLSFLESFDTFLGGVKIRCYRNPEKEARILSLVKNHDAFMQGCHFNDVKGNNVRVLEIVSGKNFLEHLHQYMEMPYASYFQTVLPGILKKLVCAFEAIHYLHVNGFKHGDIRNDHIIVQRETNRYVWIDFDYDYEATENPFSLDIFGLGNILIYTVGKGFHSYRNMSANPDIYGDILEYMEPGDFALLDKRRFINLKKMYPVIPTMLNDILMHFSMGAEIYYEMVDEIVQDLNRCIDKIF